MTSIRDEAIHLQGSGGPMLGIVSRPVPGAAASRTGIVVVVGGAQYRVGSHRQFVLMARALARSGHTVLRFDLPGMGDSPGEPVPFDASHPHIGAAVDALAGLEGVDQVVLWGLCDGASASLLYLDATGDPRVAGLALLNPWVRSEASLARTQVRHYYRQRLLEPDFWRKLMGGAVGRQALRDLGRNLRLMGRQAPSAPSFQDRMAAAWHRFPGAVLLLLSQRDLTAQEFLGYAGSHPLWNGWQNRRALTQHTLVGADHTCSSPASARESETVLITWLQQLS